MSTSTSTRAGDVPGSVNETRIVLRPSGDRYVGGGCLVALPIVILPTAIGSVSAPCGCISDPPYLQILQPIFFPLVLLAYLPPHVNLDPHGFPHRDNPPSKTPPSPLMPPLSGL